MKLYYSKAFDTENGFFLYDGLVNCLYAISEDVYNIIQSEDVITNSQKFYYDEYIKKNNIRDATIPVEIDIAHDYTADSIKNFIDNHRKLLILSVTSQCNLRCTYCIYQEKFENMDKNKQIKNFEYSMTFDTAKKAIDQMVEKSLNLRHIHIGFYGGESLLEFELIKKCVSYVNSRNIGVEFGFGITTNGTLLNNKDIRDYLSEHNFSVSVSLDGPKKIHDRYRFTCEREETFDIIISNLKQWYAEYPTYFLQKVSINAVYAPPFHHKAMDDFFEALPIEFTYGPLSSTNYFENHMSNISNEYANKIVECDNVNLYENDVSYYKNFHVGNSGGNDDFKLILPGGACMPVFMRWYVNSKGEYYPCERIEESDDYNIGNVDEGVNFEKILKLMDRYVNIAKKCENCWAVRLCTRCHSNIHEDCDNYRNRLEEDYKYYIENIIGHKNSEAELDKLRLYL